MNFELEFISIMSENNFPNTKLFETIKEKAANTLCREKVVVNAVKYTRQLKRIDSQSMWKIGPPPATETITTTKEDSSVA